jgi:FkbM family methyltransferase
VNGSRLLVGRGDTGLTGNVYVGLHEFEDMAFVLHFLRDDDLFVDVGANAGAYSILASSVNGCRVIAFEPVPSAYCKLLTNVRLNDRSERIQCVNVAVTDSPGEIEFSSASDTTNHAIAADEVRHDAIRVKATTLDLALQGQQPTLVKVDVEGYEALVVQGGESTLQNDTLLAVIMELNGSGKRYGFDDAQVTRVMNGYGFTACEYEPFSRRLTAVASRENADGNVVFVRDIELVRQRLQAAASVTLVGVSF